MSETQGGKENKRVWGKNSCNFMIIKIASNGNMFSLPSNFSLELASITK